jgi:hypothetical protein
MAKRKEQTKQWPREKDRQTNGQEKGTKRQTMNCKILNGQLKIWKHEPHKKTGGEFRCFGMVKN